MRRGSVWIGVCVLAAATTAGFVAWRASRQPPPTPAPAEMTALEIRRALFDAVQPVRVTNCELARFGEAHDGGYLMCGNLLAGVAAGYSYGIDGFDGWGCQVSNTLKVPVHQYDCFNTTRPSCVADATFHEECVGPSAGTMEGGSSTPCRDRSARPATPTIASS